MVIHNSYMPEILIFVVVEIINNQSYSDHAWSRNWGATFSARIMVEDLPIKDSWKTFWHHSHANKLFIFFISEMI